MNKQTTKLKIYLETERLIHREFVPEDLDNMFELDSDPLVHKYLGNNPVFVKEHLVQVIDSIRKQYIDNGIGRWAVIEKGSNKFIGWSGLKFVREETNNHIDYYDIGYRLIPKYWGKGYATESATACLQYGFEQLNAEIIYAAAQVENAASNKILQKIGLIFQETFKYHELTCNWYKLERGEYIKNE